MAFLPRICVMALTTEVMRNLGINTAVTMVEGLPQHLCNILSASSSFPLESYSVFSPSSRMLYGVGVCAYKHNLASNTVQRR